MVAVYRLFMLRRYPPERRRIGICDRAHGV